MDNESTIEVLSFPTRREKPKKPKRKGGTQLGQSLQKTCQLIERYVDGILNGVCACYDDEFQSSTIYELLRTDTVTKAKPFLTVNLKEGTVTRINGHSILVKPIVEKRDRVHYLTRKGNKLYPLRV